MTAHNIRRAWGVCALFSAFGVAGLVYAWGADPWILAASVLAYAVLLWQTFFSVRRFTSLLEEEHVWQHITDSALVLLYAGIAASFAAPTRFLFLLTLMFAAATVKYAWRHPQKKETALFRRKIIAEGVGTIACLVALGVSFVDPFIGVWVWTAAFVLANLTVYRPKKLYA